MISRIIILDVYRKTSYRISKDTSGGYGTGNDFGEGLVPFILKKSLKYASDWPPLFAAYTHAILNKKYKNVDYKKINSFDEIKNQIEDYDYFIIVSSIVCCETELNLIQKLYKRKKKCIAIGPFSSNKPDLYIKSGASVVIGEPENFFFYEEISTISSIPKKLLANNNIDLNLLPLPQWNILLNLNKIKLYGKYKSIPIIGTRGCPYSCFRYCVYPLQQGRIVRQRSPSNIFNEIEFWYKNFGVRLFIFRDPVFSINKKHTIELCEIIIKSNIKVKFVIETHLRLLDEELLNILKKAGLIFVKVGIENADEEILHNEKRFSVKNDEQLNKINLLKKNNIGISAMYILGFPTDNEESIKKTISYAIKLNTEYAQFSIWTPYPGTPVFNEFKNNITVKNYESFDQYRLTFNHKNLTYDQIRDFLSLAYKNYYTRFSWLINYVYKKLFT
jgi:radical SAM superfamily enzyme YgiQ (UPF0313 family)